MDVVGLSGLDIISLSYSAASTHEPLPSPSRPRTTIMTTFRSLTPVLNLRATGTSRRSFDLSYRESFRTALMHTNRADDSFADAFVCRRPGGH